MNLICLKIIQGFDEGIRFRIEEDQSYLIGTGKHCNLVLDRGNLGTSREHAELAVKKNTVHIKNLSYNGIFINGKRKGKAKIKIGDTIKLGSTVLILEGNQNTSTRISQNFLYIVAITGIAVSMLLLWRFSLITSKTDIERLSGKNEQINYSEGIIYCYIQNYPVALKRFLRLKLKNEHVNELITICRYGTDLPSSDIRSEIETFGNKELCRRGMLFNLLGKPKIADRYWKTLAQKIGPFPNSGIFCDKIKTDSKGHMYDVK